jgi:enoyl-CoA hydratase/carnithine racemase
MADETVRAVQHRLRARLPRGDCGTFAPTTDPKASARTIWEGTRLLTALLDIDIPIIGAANGAAHVHSELLVLSDILIADDHATFRWSRPDDPYERPSPST